MPKPVPLPVREKIFERMEKGHAPGDIAADLGLQVDTVRKLLRRFRQQGRAGVKPSYQQRGNPRASAALLEEACALRRAHARWGAGLLRVLLAEQHPGQTLPSLRTLERALRRAGLGPAPRGPHPGRRRNRAQRVHETWQMDAAEHLRVANGQEACWLRLTDECSGAVLKTVVFPPGELVLCPGAGDATRAA